MDVLFWICAAAPPALVVLCLVLVVRRRGLSVGLFVACLVVPALVIAGSISVFLSYYDQDRRDAALVFLWTLFGIALLAASLWATRTRRRHALTLAIAGIIVPVLPLVPLYLITLAFALGGGGMD